MSLNAMSAPEIMPVGKKCPDCGGTCGLHSVTCSRYVCSTCGASGVLRDHYGGCPTMRGSLNFKSDVQPSPPDTKEEK